MHVGRERVAQLNGTLDIESGEGGGTTLFVRIPITDGERAHPGGIPPVTPDRPSD